jgi:catechol 2,3-dioxygenase-like lactoylglutathione lyase family enzyme
MDMKLELVTMPVSDVDQAKAFYLEKVGIIHDVDVQPSDGMRVVQLTPPGSACSIVIGTGLDVISDMTPGTLKGCTSWSPTSTHPGRTDRPRRICRRGGGRGRRRQVRLVR